MNQRIREESERNGTFFYINSIEGTHQVVESGAEKYIFRGGMPFYVSDSSLVSLQFYQPFCQMHGQTPVRDVPQLYLQTHKNSKKNKIYSTKGIYSAIVRTGRDHVVIERIPFYIQHRSCVSCHSTSVKIQSSRLQNNI
jgi:hypothetical protein